MPSPLVVVETMPRALRESHEVAGNAGCYPLNGSRRAIMTLSAARESSAEDPDWTSVIRRASATDRKRYTRADIRGER